MQVKNSSRLIVFAAIFICNLSACAQNHSANIDRLFEPLIINENDWIAGSCCPRQRTANQGLQRYEYEEPHMGTRFRLVFYAQSDSTAEIAAQKSFNKIDSLNAVFSDYETDSELNKLSSQSGEKRWIPVSSPLYQLLEQSVQISSKTEGAFDITIGPYVNLWRNLANQYQPELPPQDTLQILSERVGYQMISFNKKSQAIKLTANDMQLDLGGIAKGYTADAIIKILQSEGIESALVDAGGDITTSNAPPGRSGWIITIPCYVSANKTGWMELSLKNKAIASSGDLFQHITIDGVRYSHIVDPNTGLGVIHQALTSVLASDGATADGYASAFNVMQPADAISLAQQHTDLQLNINYLRDNIFSRKSTSYFSQLRCTE